MVTRTIYYKTNKSNPDAVEILIYAAERCLKAVPGVISFNTGKPSGDPSRKVVDNDYDLGVQICFASLADAKAYEQHRYHEAWVRLVLHGWMLEGTTAEDPEQEFMESIMSGKHSDRKWVRNPSVPDSEVVWAGEVVRQFGK